MKAKDEMDKYTRNHRSAHATNRVNSTESQGYT